MNDMIVFAGLLLSVVGNTLVLTPLGRPSRYLGVALSACGQSAVVAVYLLSKI